MDMPVSNRSEIDALVDLVDDDNAFDIPHAELLPRQLAAIDECFQDRLGKIKLLANRAEEGNISQVREASDVVPLLFAHTAYKSYPENWLLEEKWDRMAKWLDTVSSNRVPKLDTSAVNGLDEWLALLEQHDHFVSCSSGTTGKCAMMNATAGDNAFSGKSLLQGLLWSGLEPRQDRMMISCGQVAATARNKATGAPMYAAIVDPAVPSHVTDAPPITIGGITEMVVLRKKMADGTATPADVEYYEAQAKVREASIARVGEQAAEALIANRHRKLHITGMVGQMYQVAAMVRERGYSAKDFQENTTFIAGGLKRMAVPDDYWEIITGTFNLTPERVFKAYGMQELSTNAPQCSAGRYHMAPWVMLLLLDESGENLIEPCFDGEVEGRAAFFDLALQGRWGGVISGDKITATWGTCECGQRSPSVGPDIQRYADSATGDKIACAGTIDAYVRGVT
jgi:hypothetical protein